MNRNENVSLAKGLGIILMVLGHTGFSYYGNGFIYMFHMPLFFFLSGYCFKEKYLGNTKDFILRRIKGLYKPYVKWGLFFLILHNFFFIINFYNGDYGYNNKVSHLYSFGEFLNRGFHVIVSMTCHEQLIGGYWFLHTLFFSSLFFYFIIKYLNTSIGGCVLMISSILASYFSFKVPLFDIKGTEFLAAFFILTGYLYKKSGFRLEDNVMYLPIFIIIVVFGEIFWRSSMENLSFATIIPLQFLL